MFVARVVGLDGLRSLLICLLARMLPSGAVPTATRDRLAGIRSYKNSAASLQRLGFLLTKS